VSSHSDSSNHQVRTSVQHSLPWVLPLFVLDAHLLIPAKRPPDIPTPRETKRRAISDNFSVAPHVAISGEHNHDEVRYTFFSMDIYFIIVSTPLECISSS
jgi:hypothetical protein